MAEPSVPVCWICGTSLRLKITHNRNGKAALTLWCAEDGRHLRAFCNHRPVVEEVVARLEAQVAAVPALAAGAEPAAPTEEALQNDSGGPASAPGTKKAAAGGVNSAMLALAVAVILLAAFTWPGGPWRWWW